MDHSKINTNNLIALWQWFCSLNLTSEHYIPLVNLFFDGTRFNFSFNWPVEVDLDTAKFREAHTIIQREAKTYLRIGERVKPIGAFETWVAWGFSIFDSSEKCLHCLINTSERILQNLAVNVFVFGSDLFNLR